MLEWFHQMPGWRRAQATRRIPYAPGGALHPHMPEVPVFALRTVSVVRIFTTVAALAMGVVVVPRAAAQKPSPPYVAADLWIDSNADALRAVNHRIWSHPEVGLQEHYSSEQLTTLLERAGFEVERGVAGMPTAFVASAGEGRPIIGILAEYDALPGVSQAPTPDRRPREAARRPKRPVSARCTWCVPGSSAISTRHCTGTPVTRRASATPRAKP
jgi:hypothetical protein